MTRKTTIAALSFVAGAAAGLALDRIFRPKQELERYRLAHQLGRRLLDTLIESLPPAQGIGRL